MHFNTGAQCGFSQFKRKTVSGIICGMVILSNLRYCFVKYHGSKIYVRHLKLPNVQEADYRTVLLQIIFILNNLDHISNKTLAKRLLELEERLGISSGVCQAKTAVHTAKRQESVRLFGSDRVCLKSVQPLCLIESASKALSRFVSFEYA